MKPKLKIKLLHECAQLPHKAHEDDACYDVYACLEEPIIVPPLGKAKTTTKVPLGFAMQLPDKTYQAKLLGRSGLNFSGKLAVIGTIDFGYTGEVAAGINNLSDKPLVIEHGMKIAQLDIQRVYDMDLQVVDTLEETERGANGFGSTGL